MQKKELKEEGSKEYHPSSVFSTSFDTRELAQGCRILLTEFNPLLLFTLNPLQMDKLGLYLRESYNELVHNVTWPSYSTLQTNTILVLVGSAIFALLIFFMDVIWQFVVDFVYGLSL